MAADYLRDLEQQIQRADTMSKVSTHVSKPVYPTSTKNLWPDHTSDVTDAELRPESPAHRPVFSEVQNTEIIKELQIPSTSVTSSLSSSLEVLTNDSIESLEYTDIDSLMCSGNKQHHTSTPMDCSRCSTLQNENDKLLQKLNQIKGILQVSNILNILRLKGFNILC